MNAIERVGRVLDITRASLTLATSDGDPASLVLELRERLQTAREEVLALREAISDQQEAVLQLEKRLAEATNFQDQKVNFVQRKLDTGALVYVLDPARGGEHEDGIYLCAHCFEAGKKRYLQPQEQQAGRDTYSCQECGSRILVPNNLVRRPRKPRSIRSKGITPFDEGTW